MKTLGRTLELLSEAGRWDIDFHLPAEGIKLFPKALWKRVDEVASLVKDKRDPTRTPEAVFRYVDIASVDVAVGIVQNVQEVEGDEAPSRARKVVSAYDIIISTCRPTRGAIAVMPADLHNEIVSTAFSVWRANSGVNPYYLHYALRLGSTLEQFRKWSTGSSYPAILDEDVAKTIIPVPTTDIQDKIAASIVEGLTERANAIAEANHRWRAVTDRIASELSGRPVETKDTADGGPSTPEILTAAEVAEARQGLPPLTTDRNGERVDSGQMRLDA